MSTINFNFLTLESSLNHNKMHLHLLLTTAHTHTEIINNKKLNMK